MTKAKRGARPKRGARVKRDSSPAPASSHPDDEPAAVRPWKWWPEAHEDFWERQRRSHLARDWESTMAVVLVRRDELAKLGDVQPVHGVERALASAAAREKLALLPHGHLAADPSHWIEPLLAHGMAAVLDAVAIFVEMADLSWTRTNTLVALSDSVGWPIREAILRDQLTASNWSLVDAAEKLRLSGTPNVIRAIKQHGLQYEYAEAKKRGLAQHGGVRRRPSKKL